LNAANPAAQPKSGFIVQRDKCERAIYYVYERYNAMASLNFADLRVMGILTTANVMQKARINDTRPRLSLQCRDNL
jgi:hypothetical protein